MSTRVYPLFQKGNPQLRIFLPNFWMKVIRPKEPLPPYMALFQTSIKMTDYDVTNYLVKIYNLPVVSVKTFIRSGTIRPAYGELYLVKEDDYKEAMVTFDRKFNFTYPDIVDDSKEEEEKGIEKARDRMKILSERMKTSTGIKSPLWFV